LSFFERPVTGASIKTACAVAIASSVLCACSGGRGSLPMPPSTDVPSSDSAVQSRGVTASDFKRIAAWGSKGKLAVVQCPQGYKVIAGGSSSSDGSFVGTGYADSNRTGWIVKPDSSASAEAFATCVSKRGVGESFRWRAAGPASGLASAQCRVGYMLISGYGTAPVTASWFDPTTNTYWVSGGGTAYASCARNTTGIVIKHAWNKSQKPKDVYAGCGNGYTVIGGAMGNSAWPGPPIQEHPGVASGPGVHGYDGWWTFSNALNELTWAACVRA
jgi:hypothetical protein